MNTAFYAPLKAPDHPVPSGDRQMARLLIEALERAGLAPALACRLRSYDRGEPWRQRRLDEVAARAAPLLARRWRRRLVLREFASPRPGEEPLEERSRLVSVQTVPL